MSQYTQKTKPFFQAITNGRKDEEEKELQQIKKDKESGASASFLNSRIDAMGNRMKQKNNSNVDKLTDRMKEITPKTANERVVFSQWMDNEAEPMVAGVIKLMGAIFGNLIKAAKDIIANFVRAAGAIVDFISDRASAVIRFFTRWF